MGLIAKILKDYVPKVPTPSETVEKAIHSLGKNVESNPFLQGEMARRALDAFKRRKELISEIPDLTTQYASRIFGNIGQLPASLKARFDDLVDYVGVEKALPMLSKILKDLNIRF